MAKIGYINEILFLRNKSGNLIDFFDGFQNLLLQSR